MSHHIDAVKPHFMGNAGAEALVNSGNHDDVAIGLKPASQLGGGGGWRACAVVGFVDAVGSRSHIDEETQ